MSPIRYRRTSVRTALGITKEEKRIKRELGITALLKPFRWWGNENRKLKRDVGYYSPEAKFARHFLPRSVIHFFTLVVVIAMITFGIWAWKFVTTSATPDKAAAIGQPGQLR
jgi:hypothetical protein